MEKIKVAMIGAAGKMGTRMSRSLLTMYADRYEVKIVEDYAPAIPRVEQELGMKCVTAQEALDFADIVVFAVKDSMIKELSKQYVPMLKPGTVFMIIDPAAAIAKEVTLRDDCTFVVTHPCHPSFFKWQKEEAAIRMLSSARSAVTMPRWRWSRKPPSACTAPTRPIS